jgi:tetratricopeptide (TPR) repeat protein
MNELLSVAVLAHRNGRHQDAVDLLLQILQVEKQDWLAWFYLAMAYGKLGNSKNAIRIFEVIINTCPDQALCNKAKMAVPALEAELRKEVKTPVARKATKEPKVYCIG